MEQEQFNDEAENFTYADYPIVKYQIQKYYYSIIENHRKYLELRKHNKENKNLKIYIQTLIETIFGLLGHYKSIINSREKILFKDYKKDKEIQIVLNDMFRLVGDFEINNKIMDNQTLTLCVKTLQKAHIVMGLGDIEKERPSLERAMIRT